VQRIVVQCEETGCIRAPRWALYASLDVRIVRSCDTHLARISRRQMRLSNARETIEIQEI
jgi:hypothetical protein